MRGLKFKGGGVLNNLALVFADFATNLLEVLILIMFVCPIKLSPLLILSSLFNNETFTSNLPLKPMLIVNSGNSDSRFKSIYILILFIKASFKVITKNSNWVINNKPINIHWIRTCFQPYRKSCTALYYRQFYTNNKIENHEINTSFVSLVLCSSGLI